MRQPSRSSFSLLLLALFGLAPASAQAAWPSSPTANVPVCTAPRSQIFRSAVSDGFGGVIVGWQDLRSDTADVYVQRVSANGVPLWTANGVRVCGAPNTQDAPTLAPDGSGGALLAWRDERADFAGDIYVQRVSPEGVPLWAADGVGVCTLAGTQMAPVIVGDGLGGALVAWEDWRSGVAVFAQRVNVAGVATGPAQGFRLAPSATPQFEPQLVTDGLQGAIAVWSQQAASGYDVHGQRFDAQGNLYWGANGAAVCTAPGQQLRPVIAPDGASGAFVAWEDWRGGGGDVYAQRMNAFGLGLWAANGVALVAATDDQTDPAIASATGAQAGGAPSAVVAWRDQRSGADDIWAQRVNASGQKSWGSTGTLVCDAPGDQTFPSVASDGAGGALIVWEDLRHGQYDIYGQRMLPSGATRWLSNGTPVTTSASSQVEPFVVTDADTIGVAVWTDFRSGVADIYAQRIPFAITVDAPPPAPAGASGLRILGVSPQPLRGEGALRFALGARGDVDLALFDASGRKVAQLAQAAFEAGVHRVRLDADGAKLANGVYFTRLASRGRVTSARVVIASR